jgi:hypothetical protein
MKSAPHRGIYEGGGREGGVRTGDMRRRRRIICNLKISTIPGIKNVKFIDTE